jgi:hypothetical protein
MYRSVEGEVSCHIKLPSVVRALIYHRTSTDSEQEAQTGQIDLTADGVDCVTALYTFFYNLDYSEGLFPTNSNHLAMHVKICIVADKYGVSSLQALATEKFKKYATETITEDDLTEAAQIAYEAVDVTAEIRAHIVKVAMEKEFLTRGEASANPSSFESFARTCPDLATDALQSKPALTLLRTLHHNCYNSSPGRYTTRTIDVYCGISAKEAKAEITAISVVCGHCSCLQSVNTQSTLF